MTDDIETVLAATGVTANTWQSAARRLADENRRLRAELAGGEVDDYDYTAADLQPRCPDRPNHRAVPGPDYWSWRCLKCDGEVRNHPSLWQRLRSVIRPGRPEGGGAV